MIYTSYFGNSRNFPENFTTIAICAKSPEGYNGLEYKALAPSYNTFKKYKDTGNESEFTASYKSETLSKLKQPLVVRDLEALANSNKIILLCYEKKGSFCHRTLVGEWLRESGYDVQEL